MDSNTSSDADLPSANWLEQDYGDSIAGPRQRRCCCCVVSKKQRRICDILWAILLFAITATAGVIISMYVASIMRINQITTVRATFAEQAAEVNRYFQRSFETYNDRSTMMVNFLETADFNVTTAQFRGFSNSFVVSGVSSNCWVPYVATNQYYSYIRRNPAYSSQGPIWRRAANRTPYPSPPGQPEGYYPIKFVEPETQTNLAGIGFDAAGSPVRLTAIEYARDTCQAISPSVTVLGADLSYNGWLLYRPAYNRSIRSMGHMNMSDTRNITLKYPDPCSTTLAWRRKHFAGVILTSLKLKDFFIEITKTQTNVPNFQIFDGRDLLYTYHSQLNQGDGGVRVDLKKYWYRNIHSLDVAQRNWTIIMWQPNTWHSEQLNQTPVAIFIAGVIITVLILLMASCTFRQHFVVLEAVTTHEEDKELRMRIAGLASDMMLILDSNDCVTFCNEAFTNATGYRDEEVQGCPVSNFILGLPSPHSRNPGRPRKELKDLEDPNSQNDPSNPLTSAAESSDKKQKKKPKVRIETPPSMSSENLNNLPKPQPRGPRKQGSKKKLKGDEKKGSYAAVAQQSSGSLTAVKSTPTSPVLPRGKLKAKEKAQEQKEIRIELARQRSKPANRKSSVVRFTLEPKRREEDDDGDDDNDNDEQAKVHPHLARQTNGVDHMNATGDANTSGHNSSKLVANSGNDSNSKTNHNSSAGSNPTNSVNLQLDTSQSDNTRVFTVKAQQKKARRKHKRDTTGTPTGGKSDGKPVRGRTRQFGRCRHMECEVLKVDGTRFAAELSYSVSTRTDIVTVLVVRDVSEKKSMIDNMEKAEKEAIVANQMKTEFLSFICHELRNPLHAMCGLTDHVSQFIQTSSDTQALLDADIEDNLQGIVSCVNQMRCIVDDVLDLHKIESGNMQFEKIAVDLSALLQSVTLQRPEPNPGVRFCLDDRLGTEPTAEPCFIQHNETLNSSSTGKLEITTTSSSKGSFETSIRRLNSDPGPQRRGRGRERERVHSQSSGDEVLTQAQHQILANLNSAKNANVNPNNGRKHAPRQFYLTDPTRLSQVLLNLMGNALKFTTKGWVHLRVHRLPGPPLDMLRGSTLSRSGRTNSSSLSDILHIPQLQLVASTNPLETSSSNNIPLTIEDNNSKKVDSNENSSSSSSSGSGSSSNESNESSNESGCELTTTTTSSSSARIGEPTDNSSAHFHSAFSPQSSLPLTISPPMASNPITSFPPVIQSPRAKRSGRRGLRLKRGFLAFSPNKRDSTEADHDKDNNGSNGSSSSAERAKSSSRKRSNSRKRNKQDSSSSRRRRRELRQHSDRATVSMITSTATTVAINPELDHNNTQKLQARQQEEQKEFVQNQSDKELTTTTTSSNTHSLLRRDSAVFDSTKYHWICFSVIDTGIGMTREAASQLFNPYFQANSASSDFKGTGLGLSIVKRLVTAFGGTIDVYTELGKGSTFSVNLPMELTTPPDPTPTPAGSASSSGINITANNHSCKVETTALPLPAAHPKASALSSSQEVKLSSNNEPKQDSKDKDPDKDKDKDKDPDRDKDSQHPHDHSPPDTPTAEDHPERHNPNGNGNNANVPQEPPPAEAEKKSKTNGPPHKEKKIAKRIKDQRAKAFVNGGSQGTGSPNQEFILVVEDVPMNQKIVVRMLSTCGYAVRVAANGAEGVRQMYPELQLTDQDLGISSGQGGGPEPIQTLSQSQRPSESMAVSVISLTKSPEEQHRKLTHPSSTLPFDSATSSLVKSDSRSSLSSIMSYSPVIGTRQDSYHGRVSSDVTNQGSSLNVPSSGVPGTSSPNFSMSPLQPSSKRRLVTTQGLQITINPVPESHHPNQNVLAHSSLSSSDQIANNSPAAPAASALCVCVLMDLMMPVMDGFQSTTYIRKLGFEGPIIALSGNAMQRDMDRFAACGGTSFLCKPFTQSDLHSLMIPEIARYKAIMAQRAAAEQERKISNSGDVPSQQ